ncbi:MAG: hypothetical protein M3Z83_05165, partial [Actinomycetota bacterium]|nr:hypothetical protein [Actinomycetota bacterium]
MPVDSTPHGVDVDAAGQLFVSFQCTNGPDDTRGQIARVDPRTGAVLETHELGADPHRLSIGGDGRTVCFTGKLSKVGRIGQNGDIAEFATPTPDSRPIDIVADPRGGGLWFSQGAGNNVAHVDLQGVITVYPRAQVAGQRDPGCPDLRPRGRPVGAQCVNQDPQLGPQGPPGDDHIVKIAGSALTRPPAQMQPSDVPSYWVP